MKYSIIIPVYNVEKYIGRCLESILNQSYEKYEVIVVNDGSPDNSVDIINKYVKKDKRFKLFTKENGGLSDARNYGVKQASGDIIIFIDGDDYIDRDLLLKVNEEISINRDIEVVRYQLRLVNDSGLVLEQPGYKVFSGISSIDSYKTMLENNYVDVAWGYAYRKDFFVKNNFEYAKGRIHEDLGLTHLILVKANKISSIDYIGYNYVQREGSIINTYNRKQNLRKVYDILYHFDNYVKILNNDSSITKENKTLLLNYVTQAVLGCSRLLEGKDLKEYVKEVRKRRVYKLLPNKTKKDKIKRMVVKYFLNQYLKKRIG